MLMRVSKINLLLDYYHQALLGLVHVHQAQVYLIRMKEMNISRAK